MVIGVIMKDLGSTIAAIEGMVTITRQRCSCCSRHASILAEVGVSGKRSEGAGKP